MLFLLLYPSHKKNSGCGLEECPAMQLANIKAEKETINPSRKILHKNTRIAYQLLGSMRNSSHGKLPLLFVSSAE